MYAIYVNDRPLTLLSETEHRTRDPANPPAATHLTAHYRGKPRTLLHYVDMLEKGSPKVQSVDLIAADLVRAWADFRGHFRIVAAAGGVVRHAADDRVLAIYRRGSWDLPKGKIDPGEDAPTAALREVREETGLSELTLGPALPDTYHVYRDRKERRVLKPTYWFAMTTSETKLVPQAEEDIERAEWLPLADLRSRRPLYGSLCQLLSEIGTS